MATRDLLAGALLGAGLVYFLDPARGGERRRHAGRRLAGWLDLGRREPTTRHYGTREGDLAGLEAANLTPALSPAALGPALLAAVGGALALYGLTRQGGKATLASAVGVGLLSGRSRTAAAPAGPERRRVVDIQKSIHIAAPVASVFGFWDSYESFPLFLTSVREVADLGGGRSRWVVHGPGGVPIEWCATLTERIPGRLIAWRSEPGSMLVNAGAIRFTPEQGGTRVDLRLCYQPPADGPDEAVTALVGSDPRARLNEDLERLRAVLEGTARREARGQEPRS